MALVACQIYVLVTLPKLMEQYTTLKTEVDNINTGNVVAVGSGANIVVTALTPTYIPDNSSNAPTTIKAQLVTGPAGKLYDINANFTVTAVNTWVQITVKPGAAFSMAALTSWSLEMTNKNTSTSEILNVFNKTIIPSATDNTAVIIRFLSSSVPGPYTAMLKMYV